jgi:alanine-glyoxylate transaminase/serine-glyoxylate transaminase/serine-pyruvate transaminase
LVETGEILFAKRSIIKIPTKETSIIFINIEDMDPFDCDLGPVPHMKELNPPPRLMLGPGPSNAHPRVYQAMAMPQVGHLDPVFLHIVEEIKDLLRYVWQTTNVFTIPVSGTASAAWEACCANLLEPGDITLAFVNGYFGNRHCDMASRYGATVIKV